MSTSLPPHSGSLDATNIATFRVAVKVSPFVVSPCIPQSDFGAGQNERTPTGAAETFIGGIAEMCGEGGC
jgi:hypothetical protein